MRTIIETDEFQAQVDKLGGAQEIDEVLRPFIESLSSNPYGFHKFESDGWSLRWFTTLETHRGTPALYVAFTIEPREPYNVILTEIGALHDLG